MKDTIIEAIHTRQLLHLIYKGASRTLEPYLLYESKGGEEILHGWQIEGAWERTPPPDWCNFRLDEITTATALDEHYDQPRPDYNPDSKQFHHVIIATPKRLFTRSAGG